MPIAARRPPRYIDGIELPRGVDGRTKTSRRFLALISAFAAELGGNLTEADKSLVKQAAALALQTEQLQADIVAGAKVDPDTLIRVSSEARRALTKVRTRAKGKPLDRGASFQAEMLTLAQKRASSASPGDDATLTSEARSRGGAA